MQFEDAEAYSNVGLVYLMKAQDYADKATTDINDPKYAEAHLRIPSSKDLIHAAVSPLAL